MENRGVLRSLAHPSRAIAAASVSTLIAPLFDPAGDARRGRVLSVHGGAINLRLDGVFVTVATVRTGGLPNGVLVGESFAPRLFGIREGMSIRAADNELAIDDAGVTFRLGAARRWRPEMPVIAAPGDLDVRTGIACGAAARTRGGLDGIVNGGVAFAALHAALASGSEPVIVAAGRALVGLGAGLTPAGDDVLVGLTAGLTGLGDPRARRLATAWARHANGRTTVVAEAFHRHAAAGAYSERLHDLLRAILCAPTGAIPAAFDAAAAWGATSGADTIAGVLLALRQPPEAAGGRADVEAA